MNLAEIETFLMIVKTKNITKKSSAAALLTGLRKIFTRLSRT